MEKRKYDSMVARIAGNIAFGLVVIWDREFMTSAPGIEDAVISQSVRMARAIVAETERTEPVEPATS
jgi:hypothetical protein